jgi:hypothetical protein
LTFTKMVCQGKQVPPEGVGARQEGCRTCVGANTSQVHTAPAAPQPARGSRPAGSHLKVLPHWNVLSLQPSSCTLVVMTVLLGR